jgi:hypothetical protein
MMVIRYTKLYDPEAYDLYPAYKVREDRQTTLYHNMSRLKTGI